MGQVLLSRLTSNVRFFFVLGTFDHLGPCRIRLKDKNLTWHKLLEQGQDDLFQQVLRLLLPNYKNPSMFQPFSCTIKAWECFEGFWGRRQISHSISLNTACRTTKASPGLGNIEYIMEICFLKRSIYSGNKIYYDTTKQKIK